MIHGDRAVAGLWLGRRRDRATRGDGTMKAIARVITNWPTEADDTWLSTIGTGVSAYLDEHRHRLLRDDLTVVTTVPSRAPVIATALRTAAEARLVRHRPYGDRHQSRNVGSARFGQDRAILPNERRLADRGRAHPQSRHPAPRRRLGHWRPGGSAPIISSASRDEAGSSR
jgi:hypothetical protein